MGCAYKNHEIYIPLSNRMVKFNRNLQDTSTVSYIEPLDSEIAIEVLKIKKLLAEIKKCVCLCSNCHRKVHAGIINLENYLDKSSPKDPEESVTE